MSAALTAASAIVARLMDPAALRRAELRARAYACMAADRLTRGAA